MPVTFNIDIDDSSKKNLHGGDFSNKPNLDKCKDTQLRLQGHLAWHFMYLEPNSLTPTNRVIASKFLLEEFLSGLRGQSQVVFERLLPAPGPGQTVANCQQLNRIRYPRPLSESRHWQPLFY